MTIERAKRLAEQWASGGVCTLRDGEAQEYHRLFLSMLLGKQDVVRCAECKHCDPENHHCDHHMGTAAPLRRKPDDFCSCGERKEGDGNG